MPDCTAPNTTNTLPAEPILEPVDPEVEDLQLLTEEDIVEVKIVEAEGEDLEAVSESLEAYSALLKEAGTKGITYQSAAFMRVGMNHVDHILGYSKPAIGLESYKTSTLRDGLRHVVISQEDISDRIKELGKKAMEYIKKLLAMVLKFISRFTGGTEKTKQKTNYLLANISKFPAYPGGPMKGEVSEPPAGVSSKLSDIADRIKTRDESDDPKGTLTINGAKRLFANGKNTYNSIDAEQKYLIFFTYNYWNFCMNPLMRALHHAITGKYGYSDKWNEHHGKDVYEYLEERIEGIFPREVNKYLGDVYLPGGSHIEFSTENGLTLVKGDDNDPDSIEVDIRPRTQLVKFLETCKEFNENDWEASINKAVTAFEAQLSETIKILERFKKPETSEAEDKYFEYVNRIVRKYAPTAELMSQVLNTVNRSIALKVELVEAELAHY